MATTLKERAAKLRGGQLLPGEMLDSLLTVNTIDDLKELLDPGDGSAAREERTKAMFAGITPPTDDEAGLLRRVHEYVFGNAKLSAADRALVEPAFPLEVRAITVGDKTINSQWDLGTSGAPVFVEIPGTLTIAQGGYITIENTALSLTIGNLVRNGNTGIGTFSDINILGVNGSTGVPGATPNAPGQAQNGDGGECSSGGIAGHGGGPGDPGATGTVGGTGGAGGNGLPSMPATITINTSIGGTAPQISIATQSGQGGNGGPGGTGSQGGQGGNGGNGVSCGCTGNAGGNGGQGGTGGPGGVGGQGGNGVNAAGNVVVSVPAPYAGKIMKVMIVAPPGTGGGAGAGGAGGPGGGGSNGGKHNNGGNPGGSGSTGGPGTGGAYGTAIGNPANIIVQPT
jgi:hypothetical protein